MSFARNFVAVNEIKSQPWVEISLRRWSQIKDSQGKWEAKHLA
jgi:hypothetical protein